MASFETTRKPRKIKQETSEPTYETPVMSNKLLPLNSTTKPKREAIADLRRLSPTSAIRILKKPSSDRSTSTIKVPEKSSCSRSTPTLKILEKKPSSNHSASTLKILEKKPSSNRSTSTSENQENVSKNRLVIRVSRKRRRSISPPSTPTLKTLEKKPFSNRSTSTLKILEKKPSSSRSTSTLKILEKKPSSNRSTSTSANLENVSKNHLVIRVSRKRRRSISPPSTSLLCGICTDEKLNEDMFAIAACDHSYCSDCVSKYIDSKLQENIVKIGCPFLGCKGSLDPQSCQSILPRKVFDRWCDALCESLIVGSEKLYCPYKDCSALLIDARFEEKGDFECECPECHRLFCSGCKVPWHSSLTCKEYKKLRKDERGTDDIMLMSLAKKNKWMRCPSCRFYVQRSDGCPFMKCRCGDRFCYRCGSSCTRDHYCPKCKG